VLDTCGVERIVNVPLGTDVHLFQPQLSRERVRAELGLAGDARLLLFVGRMAREKNIRHLIAALDLLPAGCPPCHLLLVGDGELRDKVEREADQRANLTWLPYCESAQRLADLYSAADLFVHPGKYETFGIVALEAQACGTPVLAVREGGVEDALAGENPPWLARDGTAAGLAAGIERFLRTGDTPEKRRARRARIVRHFSIESTFERMFALYSHLAARRPAAEFSSDHPADHELSHPTLSTH
jgi:alpha-1,6-mannosyltransferase